MQQKKKYVENNDRFPKIDFYVALNNTKAFISRGYTSFWGLTPHRVVLPPRKKEKKKTSCVYGFAEKKH